MAMHLGPDGHRTGDLLPFVLLSLLAHGLLVAWLGRAPLSLGTATDPAPIVVKLAPDGQTGSPPPSKQIVSPSDRENGLAPEGPAYLSDRDNRVKEQTIRRGNPEAGTPGAKPLEASNPQAPPVAAPQPAAPPAPPAPAEAEPEEDTPRAEPPPENGARPLPGLDRLLPPPAEVLARARTNRATETQNPPPSPTTDADARRDLMVAPPPAPGLLSGLRGNFDRLPDVRAGQLTMLNTKADRFAPFVRRVGTRVFQNLLIYQRRDLDGPDLIAARRHATVKVLLDAKGKLKSYEVLERSGSPAMDRTLAEAVRQAAFDPNPPAGAKNQDGDFEFIFQAQILAQLQPGIRSQRVRAVECILRVGLL